MHLINSQCTISGLRPRRYATVALLALSANYELCIVNCPNLPKPRRDDVFRTEAIRAGCRRGDIVVR